MLSEKSNLSISTNSRTACMIVHEDVNLGRGEFVVNKSPVLELKKFTGVYCYREAYMQHFSHTGTDRVTFPCIGVCTIS